MSAHPACDSTLAGYPARIPSSSKKVSHKANANEGSLLSV